MRRTADAPPFASGAAEPDPAPDRPARMALPRRSPVFYRIVLALPLGMGGYLLASGRFAEYARLFSPGAARAAGPDATAAGFVTSLLWLAAVGPLLFAAWEIGREHTAARRLDYALWVGLREVVRRAVRTPDADAERESEAEFARPPEDRPGVALASGAAVALLLPAFFASFIPSFRTPLGLAWLLGAGVLMGIAMYCRRRAMAYLRDEPDRWDLFRNWRLMAPARYEAAGRRFVRGQIVASVLLPVWWLGGGALVLSAS